MGSRDQKPGSFRLSELDVASRSGLHIYFILMISAIYILSKLLQINTPLEITKSEAEWETPRA